MRPGTTKYPSIRDHLSVEFADVSDAQIEAVLLTKQIDAETMEGFFNDLGKFAASAGSAIVKAAPAVLPIAGTVLGTAFGGPAGAALGGALGSLAGKAIGGQMSTPSGAMGSILSSLPSGLGSPAAGQLLQTIARPQTLQALSSMALGPLGRQNIGVGGVQVPVGAFANLLGVLAGRAESEYNAVQSAASGRVPRYMQDYAGEAKGDPALSESRAEALAELLQTSRIESEAYEALEYADSAAESEALEAEAEAESIAMWELEAAEAEMLELIEA